MSPPNFTKGWVYNLEEIPNSTEAGRVIALALTFSVTACLFVVLRLGVRWKTTKIIGVDTCRYPFESPSDQCRSTMITLSLLAR